MRVFFLAETPCGLSVGGEYLGIADGFERSAALDPEGLWCKFEPCGDRLPISFLLDEDLLFAPPPQIEVYHTERGVALYARGFLPADQSLKVLRQERLGGALLTLMRQGRLQLALENETGAHLTELDEALCGSVFSARREGFLLRAENAFALLSRRGEILLFSEGKAQETGDTLEAEVPLHDCLGRTALCKWRDGKLVERTLRGAEKAEGAVFPLAFFESVLIGADAAPYLSGSLAQKAGLLKEYLGDFCAVTPTETPEKVGLVYRRRERVYDVRYFLAVPDSDGKIQNIKPL